MHADTRTYAQPCPNCGGYGRAVVTGPGHTARRPVTRTVVCTTCQGRGQR